MAWEQLSITKPHLVYIILGGFTSLFMLCSSVIKERLYIGEATVATLCGIIFGPHAANLINPLSWGNTDLITLEFSRIVLVVQCFAVGVELPKAYMERHWRSVVLLLVPVMTFGWLITSLFIWAVFHGNLNWLESLTIAACVTATDPVLASSVVGKGKFAKRVPKHLRDLLSAESGCNDGMAFPFIYLALYLINYRPHAGEVIYHWVCFTILYECVFGCFYGVAVGYIARRLIRAAHERDLIDRESFLVFYFVLALFCAGSGSLLGLDDLLVGFAAGVGFSNDGWFTEKTEESHVSNVIDLLINLAFFVYFGTIIPWEQYNAGVLGMQVWKLVVIGFLVLFFRRIPIMMMLKPIIPDIKTWREALFAGHFGPIGVGAIFVAILARAELETESTTPLAYPIPPDVTEYNVVYLIWPITTFLVICSIIVHGSSIAVFTLGKHINTLTLTMSYTQANEQGHWTDRLPRIQSRSKSSMSAQSLEEKTSGMPLVPGTFLRRQREEENPSRTQSRASSRHRSKHSRGRNWDSGMGPGGPVSQSAIQPAPRQERREESPDELGQQDPHLSRSDSDTLAMKSDPPSDDKTPENEEETDLRKVSSPGEIFEEGQETVFEDEDGNVLAVEEGNEDHGPRRQQAEVREGLRLMRGSGADTNDGVAPSEEDPDDDPAHEAIRKITGQEKDKSTPERPGRGWREGWNKMSTLTSMRRREGTAKPKPEPQTKETRGPARAYQYGNTIIVEDEDGEVIKKYEIPAPERKQSYLGDTERSKQHLKAMGKMLGLGPKDAKVEAGASGPDPAADGSGPDGKSAAPKQASNDNDEDGRVRFTITSGGRRMSKAEFIDQIRNMDPKSRVETVEDSNAPESVKQEARQESREQALSTRPRGESLHVSHVPAVPEDPEAEKEAQRPTAELTRAGSRASANNLKLVDSNQQEVPFHNVSSDVRRHGLRREDGETAAERRRRQALRAPPEEEDSEDDGTERVPPARRAVQQSSTSPRGRAAADDLEETAAERRRREGALAGQSSSSPTNRTTSKTNETAAERRRRQGALGAFSTQNTTGDDGETAAERRRREGALSTTREDSDSDENDAPRRSPRSPTTGTAEEANGQQPDQSTRRVRWGQNTGR